MESGRFDDIARLLSTRRGILGLAGLVLGGTALVGVGATAAKKGHSRKRKRRKKHKGQKRKQQRQYPVFTTCHTDSEELGPIPGGPYPTCRSQYDPDEFAPCDRGLTFTDLQDQCNQAYPRCNGTCRILAEPIVGLGDCPDFTWCMVYPPGDGLVKLGPIPGGPYGACWSWTNPFTKCTSCPGATPNELGMIRSCGGRYWEQAPAGCYTDDLNGCYVCGPGDC